MNAGDGSATRATVVVLLHGAGMEPWVWDRVRPLVGAASRAPAVPARSPDATPAGCAERIVAALDVGAQDRIVLVMHSLAGALASDLGRVLGARLQACIYVSAVIPAAGSTFARAMGFPVSLLLPVLFRLNPRGLVPSPSMIRAELCGDLSAEDADRVVSQYQAEYRGLYLSKVGAPPACRSVYVTLTEDKSVPPSKQAQMLARLPSPEVCELRSGHLAMLSHPAELAAIIDRVARAG